MQFLQISQANPSVRGANLQAGALPALQLWKLNPLLPSRHALQQALLQVLGVEDLQHPLPPQWLRRGHPPPMLGADAVHLHIHLCLYLKFVTSMQYCLKI
jgi:hypothetical protein